MWLMKSAWLIATLLLHISGYTLHHFFGAGYFFFCETAAFVSILFMLKYPPAQTVGFRCVVNLYLAIAISALLDVLFFDRKAIQLNEFVGAGAAVLFSLAEWYLIEVNLTLSQFVKRLLGKL